VQGRILGTEAQIAKEGLALRLKDAAPVQTQIRTLEELYRRDALAASPSGNATLQRAVDSIATAAAQYAANEDSDHPVAMWAVTGPHHWFGLDVPRSGYGIDNPDNIYRMMPIDGAARYEIHGKVIPPGPAQQTFVLFRGIPGVTEGMNKQGRMMELAGLKSGDLAIAADGSFTIYVDSDPAGGRSNHMRVDADNPRAHLLVRDTLADWSAQNPTALEIRRVSGPGLRSPASETQLAARAAKILASMGPYWVAWTKRILYGQPPNQIMTPWARGTGWGYTAYGNFALARDEAWVVKLDALGAAYLAFQVADPWGVSLEYVERSSSLTQTQARPNADGTYTYVVAAADPGVRNWLDTSGLDAGTFQLRWQGLPAHNSSSDGAVRSAGIVKLQDLKSVVAAETALVTAAERRAQLASRKQSFQQLLGK
jgi:hypothetical protein